MFPLVQLHFETSVILRERFWAPDALHSVTQPTCADTATSLHQQSPNRDTVSRSTICNRNQSGPCNNIVNMHNIFRAFPEAKSLRELWNGLKGIKMIHHTQVASDERGSCMEINAHRPPSCCVLALRGHTPSQQPHTPPARPIRNTTTCLNRSVSLVSPSNTPKFTKNQHEPIKIESGRSHTRFR